MKDTFIFEQKHYTSLSHRFYCLISLFFSLPLLVLFTHFHLNRCKLTMQHFLLFHMISRVFLKS
ncbi:hypothetical protein BPUM_1218 [Bacillus pumilus SAFR-032]|uniref:Uncharacterized protein n=1 Tax=Bacillus pumilus (strain SAFR-032) TaxID=315750 RepID=A8FCD5_BACP2|nr:hypothetical protein BPUM_1218 [Bacillus pumilus SAFR-032]